jgi:hypothetical protein
MLVDFTTKIDHKVRKTGTASTDEEYDRTRAL